MLLPKRVYTVLSAYAASVILASGAYAQTCDNARDTVRQATPLYMQGRPYAALETISNRGHLECPELKPLSARIHSVLGDYAAADRIDGVVESVGRIDCAANFNTDQATDWRTALMPVISESRIVVLNEFHHRPVHRAVAIQLLAPLYEQGFRYLAVEDLSPMATSLPERGWAAYFDGGEVSDPIFAQFLEEALALGFEILPYEWIMNSQSGTGDPINDRERIQAQNIVEATFDQDEDARVLVYAGIGHAREDAGLEPYPTRYMAGWLHELSGYNPLTLSQTACAALNNETEGTINAALTSDAEPIYDAAIAHSDHGNEAWPQWLAEIGRHRVEVTTIIESVQSTRPDLIDFTIEAVLPGRPPIAVPEDRIWVRGTVPVRDLSLRPGEYVIQIKVPGEDIISLDQIVVVASE
ncbi:MAG: hypothetical protein JKP96_01450 [Oceanicaulis sp.]|nr:hypothetical protein [Oceanicaulis sp.]